MGGWVRIERERLLSDRGKEGGGVVSHRESGRGVISVTLPAVCSCRGPAAPPPPLSKESLSLSLSSPL